MLKTIFRVGIVTMGVVGLASAQQPVPTSPPPATQPLPTQPLPTQPPTTQPPLTGTATPGAPGSEMMPTPYRAKEILGTRVSLQGATAVTPGAAGTRLDTVGTVDDIVFSDDGQIEYLIVENAGKLVTVPWAAAKFDMKQKSAVLAVTPEQYRLIPTYTVTTYPSFYTPAYRTETYRFYGITPGQIRRMERRR